MSNLRRIIGAASWLTITWGRGVRGITIQSRRPEVVIPVQCSLQRALFHGVRQLAPFHGVRQRALFHGVRQRALFHGVRQRALFHGVRQAMSDGSADTELLTRPCGMHALAGPFARPSLILALFVCASPVRPEPDPAQALLCAESVSNWHATRA